MLKLKIGKNLAKKSADKKKTLRLFFIISLVFLVALVILAPAVVQAAETKGPTDQPSPAPAPTTSPAPKTSPSPSPSPGTSPTPAAAAGAGIISKLLSSVGEHVVSAIVTLGGALISLFGKLLILMMEVLVWISMYNNFIDTPYVNKGWVVLRDLVNMFFVLGLLFIAFVTVLKIEKYQWNRLLARLLIMAVLVNFSKTICGIIIDFFQVIMLTFVNAFKDITGANITNALKVQDWLKVEAAGEGISWQQGLLAISGVILGVFYVIIAFVVVVIFCVMLAVRMVALWMLVVLSPLAFFAWTFESGKIAQYSQQWWNEFFNYCIIGPFIAFFLWLSLVTIVQLNYNQMVPSYDPAKREGAKIGDMKGGTMDNVLSILLGVVILVMGLSQAGKMGVAGASLATSAAGKVKSMTVGNLERAATRTYGAAAGVTKGVAKGVVKAPFKLAGVAAGAAGGFAYRQYIKPRAKGVAQDLSKAWQTKTGYGDFGKKVVSGFGESFAASESPTLRLLGRALGKKPPEEVTRPLPKGVKGVAGKAWRLAKKVPGFGDFIAMSNAAIREASLSGELNDHIKNKTQAKAAARSTKDEKPIREEDRRYEDDLVKKLGIDVKNQDQVTGQLDALLIANKGKKITSEPLKRQIAALYRAQADLGVSNSATYRAMRRIGVFDGEGDLYRRIYDNSVEESEKKSRGNGSAISGDFYNEQTKRREDYTPVKKKLEGADDELTARLGWDGEKEDRIRKSIDFNSLRKKNAQGKYELDLPAIGRLIQSGTLTADQTMLLQEAGKMAGEKGKEDLANGGLAMSTEFEKKRAMEKLYNIKMGGGEAVINAASYQYFANPWKTDSDSVAPMIDGVASNRQRLGLMAKDPRDIATLKLDFWEMQDAKDAQGNIVMTKNERRLKLLQDNPEKLADFVEGIEGESNKSLAQITAADLQKSEYVKDTDRYLSKASEENVTDRQGLHESFTAKYDAQGKMEEPGRISDDIQSHLEEVRATEGLDTKINNIIKTLAPNADAKLIAKINTGLDKIMQIAKSQVDREANIEDLITPDLANLSVPPTDIKKIAASLSETYKAVNKRIKSTQECFKEYGSKIKIFTDELNKKIARGEAPTPEDLGSLEVLKNSIIRGLERNVKNNALDPSKFNIQGVEQRLNQMLSTRTTDPKVEMNINSLIAALKPMYAQLAATEDPKVIKDLNTKIKKLTDSFKGIYNELEDFGYKA